VSAREGASSYNQPVSGATLALLAAGALGLARVVYLEFLSRDARTTRTLSDRPRTRIGDGTDGVVRLTGRVRRRGELLKAPVSGRPCVAFQLLVEGDNGDGWDKLLESRDARPFVIADETGEALVDTAGGPFHLALNSDERGGTGLFDQIGEAQLQAVMSVGTFESPGRARGKRRYREGILCEGETVAVGGRGLREVSPEATSVNPRELPRWLVLRGTADEPLLISDSLDAIAPDASRLPRR
jgi:hypothetical protein